MWFNEKSISLDFVEVFKSFVRRRDECNWKISDEVIEKLLSNIPLFTDDPGVVVGIRALIPPPEGSNMSALQYTFEELWSWVSSTYNGNVFRHPDLNTDSRHLSFLEDCYNLDPGQAEWALVKLDANNNCRLTKKPNLSAGLELLSVAAQYSQRVFSMDSKDKPYWNLAGLNLFMPDVNTCPERCSPTLSVLNGRVSLLYNDTSAPYHSPERWSSPEVVGVFKGY